MAFFLLKLLPPRPTFPLDISDTERELMNRHSDYWQIFVEKGLVVAIGPVMDPEGAWGVAILEVEDENVAQTMADNDPVFKANAGFRTFILPMPNLMYRK